VYVQQLLKDIDVKVVVQIGADLGLRLPNKGLLSVNNVIELIRDNDLNSVLGACRILKPQNESKPN